jgi:hypothetical protein
VQLLKFNQFLINSFLSSVDSPCRLYWKIKYVSRLEYLWGDIKKGEVEIPDFVIEHDKVLEHRPLTDYGIEPDPLHLADVPAAGYSLGRYENKWFPEDRFYSGNYM